MPNTYRRLEDNTWGVLIPLAGSGDGEDDGLGQPMPGTPVTMTKRDGQQKTEKLGELISKTEQGYLFRIASHRQPAAPRTATPVGNLTGLIALFDRARQHLRFPAIVLSAGPATAPQTLRLTVATERSRVPGSINVASFYRGQNGQATWFGRVHQNGTFEQREGGPEIAARLTELAADPARVAAEHGRLTGRCCFCNRPLEDERSTAVGYGPVCADHFGLAWGVRPREFAGAA